MFSYFYEMGLIEGFARKISTRGVTVTLDKSKPMKKIRRRLKYVCGELVDILRIKVISYSLDRPHPDLTNVV